MANEAKPIELLGRNNAGEQLRYTCAEATTIPKGSLLKLTNQRTVAVSDGDGDILAGIASIEKKGGDGSTEISVWTKGVFNVKANTGISAGDNVVGYVSTGNANEVDTDNTEVQNSKVLGVALDDESGGQVSVAVGVY